MNRLEIATDLDPSWTLSRVFRGIGTEAENAVERFADMQGIPLGVDTRIKHVDGIGSLILFRGRKSGTPTSARTRVFGVNISNGRGRFFPFLVFEQHSNNLIGDDFTPSNVHAQLFVDGKVLKVGAHKYFRDRFRESVGFSIRSDYESSSEEYRSWQDKIKSYGKSDESSERELAECNPEDLGRVNVINKSIRLASAAVLSILAGNNYAEVLEEANGLQRQILGLEG
ncbi:hypothetical protein KC960_02865 [Candidatus Saccharibacteria bacterium]|nr:hypothetical protein [Candidatus Saccharibacteria bacterium]